MTGRLHLPHPHIPAVLERLHHHTPTTDPDAVARWAEWRTPDQWLAEHGRKENPDA